jgi:hypothetical protein
MARLTDEQRIARYSDQLARAKARKQKKARGEQSRRRTLAGTLLLEAATSNAAIRVALVEELDRGLTKDRDRMLFGLPPASELRNQMRDWVRQRIENLRRGEVEEARQHLQTGIDTLPAGDDSWAPPIIRKRVIDHLVAARNSVSPPNVERSDAMLSLARVVNLLLPGPKWQSSDDN